MEAPWLTLLQAGKLISVEEDVRDKLMGVTFGVKMDEEWESVMVSTIGICELGREVAARVLRTRGDSDW